MKEIPEEVLAKVLAAIRDEQGQRKQLADDPRLLIAGFSTPHIGPATPNDGIDDFAMLRLNRFR